GVYGTSGIAALTAQNTVGVRRVEAVGLEMIADQIDAVAEDLRPAAWKTGMLGTAAIITLVVDRLQHHSAANLVVDPVMIAKSGDALLEPPAVDSLRRLLLPRAL